MNCQENEERLSERKREVLRGKKIIIRRKN
jgi:hypothetical protein